jgi:DNA polymerase-3 subunit alpha
VYQEQVLEIARQLAGFSYGEADMLRKAVGKKIKALLDEQEYKMIEGMVKNNIPSDIAKQIWEFILPFARYGFNRSHAACYAMIAYRTAYLKANYPAQFMAALMTADRNDTDRIAIEIQHARDIGLEVLPPDINESFGTFAVVKDSLKTDVPQIRFGLHAIKQVGDHLIETLIHTRKADGPFTSLENVLERLTDKDLNKKSLESLIKTGVLDPVGDRSQLLTNLETLLQFSKRMQTEAATGQGNLFGGSGAVSPTINLLPAEPIDDMTRGAWEKELLGVYISGHPLQPYTDIIQHVGITIHQLREVSRTASVTVVGMISATRRLQTKAGDTMMFVNLTDATGEMEAIVFPKTFAATSLLWQADAIVVVTGKIDTKDGSYKLIIEEAERFHPQNYHYIDILVPSQIEKTAFEQLKQIFIQYPGDYEVYFVTDEQIIHTKQRISQGAIPSLQAQLGADTVRVVEYTEKK